MLHVSTPAVFASDRVEQPTVAQVSSDAEALFTEVICSMLRLLAALVLLLMLAPISPAYAYNDPVGRGLMDFFNEISAKVIPRETVSWDRGYAPGTVVVSTRERRLYYVLGGRRAIQYRRWRGSGGLYLIGHEDRHHEARMAGLEAAGAEDQSPA